MSVKSRQFHMQSKNHMLLLIIGALNFYFFRSLQQNLYITLVIIDSTKSTLFLFILKIINHSSLILMLKFPPRTSSFFK